MSDQKNTKVVLVDTQGVEVPTVPTAPARPEQIIVGLKPDAPPYPGDILVLLAPSKAKLKHGQRMSVRPQQDKCICKGHGWGVVETDDGSRFHRRAPALCKCIGQAVARICGAEAVIASWAPPANDSLLVEWKMALAGREAEAEAALDAVRADRERETRGAEAEADRIEVLATAAEPAAAEAARVLGVARDAVAGAVTAEGQARAIYEDAQRTLARARGELATAEAAHAVAAHAVNLTGAARLRATAAILRGPKSAWADKERRAVAALERVRREMGVVAGLGVVGEVRLAEEKPAAVATKELVP